MFRRRCTLLVIFILKLLSKGLARCEGQERETKACMATSRVSCSKERRWCGPTWSRPPGTLVFEATWRGIPAEAQSRHRRVETSGLDAGCEESEPRTSVHGAVGVEELDPCRLNVHESEANRPMHARNDLATLATRSRPISQKVFFAYSCQVQWLQHTCQRQNIERHMRMPEP